MIYSSLQQRIYDNKVRRGFNVTDVGKELILMTEEFGELNDGYICLRKSKAGSHEKMVDAVGDLQVYNLGLASMFGWKADEVAHPKFKSVDDALKYLKEPIYDDGYDHFISGICGTYPEIRNYFPFVARGLGRLANAYKKSNKELVEKIDQREEFNWILHKLMRYCSDMFKNLKVEEFSVLEHIVKNNETRTHEGQI